MDEFLMLKENEMKSKIEHIRQECVKAVDNVRLLQTQCDYSLACLDRKSQSFRRTFLDHIRMLEEITFTLKEFNLSIIGIETNFSSLIGPTPSEYSSKSNGSSCLSVDSVLEVKSFKHMKKDSNPPKLQDTKNIVGNKLLDININEHSMHPQEESNIHYDLDKLNCNNAGRIESTNKKCLLDCSVSDLSSSINTCTLQSTGETSIQLFDTMGDIPPQEILKIGPQYPCIITWVISPDEFYITVDVDLMEQLINDMQDYYTKHYKKLKTEQERSEIQSYMYCACFNTGTWFRAMLTAFNVDDNPQMVECFLVDVGKPGIKTTYYNLQPLTPEFRKVPVLARLCHLSCVKPFDDSKATWSKDSVDYLKQFIDKNCFITVEDNESESLGVYVITNDQTMLNLDMYSKELAHNVGHDSSINVENDSSHIANIGKHSIEKSNGLRSDCEDDVLPMGSTEEYYDPLLAVQGYQNRDEIDICKHYKGPPATTCFKGKNCNKRHELMDPDGWTKDKTMTIGGTLTEMVFPRAGTKVKLLITHIITDNTVKGQILHPTSLKDGRPFLKDSIIPYSLDALIMSMNPKDPKTRTQLTNCSVRPGLGEFFSAQYPLDNLWYRVKVLAYGDDDDVQVEYVDYGNTTWVNYKELRQLDMAHIILPVQAVTFLMADVGPMASSSPGIKVQSSDIIVYKVQCKKLLTKLILNKKIDALVTSSPGTYLEVILYDEQGIPVVETLAKIINTTIKRVTVEAYPDNPRIPG